MRSVIIGHRPKLAVLPKLVFDAQRPVANIIATANQRIIPSCNPTCLPKNYLYERVAQETTTRKIMHPQQCYTNKKTPSLPDCVFHQSCSFLLLASQHPLLVFPLSPNILYLSTQFLVVNLLVNHGAYSTHTIVQQIIVQYPRITSSLILGQVSGLVTNHTFLLTSPLILLRD